MEQYQVSIPIRQVLTDVKYLLLPEAIVPTILDLSPLSAAPMRADPSSRQVRESQLRKVN